MLILSAAAFACVEVPIVYQVSRSFTVHVKNEIGRVAGLNLKVSHFRTEEFAQLSAEQQRSADPNSFEEVIAQSTTDDNGMAHFNLNEIGRFSLSTDGPANQTWVDLDVTEQTSSPVVELQWPSTAILRTAQIRGNLSKGLFSSRSSPLAHNDLKLRTLVHYAEIAALTTDDAGTFDFGTVDPGLYFLQIIAKSEIKTRSETPEGNIPIYVRPEESHTSLRISVSNTDCGLMYDLEKNKALRNPDFTH